MAKIKGTDYKEPPYISLSNDEQLFRIQHDFQHDAFLIYNSWPERPAAIGMSFDAFSTMYAARRARIFEKRFSKSHPEAVRRVNAGIERMTERMKKAS